jgi:hypothetical protein
MGLRELPIPCRTSASQTPVVGFNLQQYHSRIHSNTFFISKKPISRTRKLKAGNVKRRQWRYLELTATFSEVPSEWMKKLKVCSEVILASSMTEKTSGHIALLVWDGLGSYKVFNIPLNCLNVYLELHLKKKARPLIP